MTNAWSVRWWFDLMLRRHGPLPPLACGVLLAGLLAWGWLLPRHAALVRSAHRLASVAAPVERPAASPAQVQAALRTALMDPKAVNDTVRALLVQARQHQVHIGKVEYRWEPAVAGRAATRVQIGLPLRGDYPAIKQFLATTLLGLPGASLDQLSLKQPSTSSGTSEQAASAEVEGMVWLSLWQRALLDGAPRTDTESQRGPAARTGVSP